QAFDRPISGRTNYLMWENRRIDARPDQRTTMLFYPKEKYISPNSDNAANGPYWKGQWTKLMYKNQTRVPKELDTSMIRNYRRLPLSGKVYDSRVPGGSLSVSSWTSNLAKY